MADVTEEGLLLDDDHITLMLLEHRPQQSEPWNHNSREAVAPTLLGRVLRVI